MVTSQHKVHQKRHQPQVPDLLVLTVFQFEVQTVGDDLGRAGDGWHSCDSVNHEFSFGAHVRGDRYVGRLTRHNGAKGLDVSATHNLFKWEKELERLSHFSLFTLLWPPSTGLTPSALEALLCAASAAWTFLALLFKKKKSKQEWLLAF